MLGVNVHLEDTFASFNFLADDGFCEVHQSRLQDAATPVLHSQDGVKKRPF